MVVSVINLLLAVVLLEAGSALMGLLVPVRGEIAGFSTLLIGAFGTVYYAGFVAGCALLPRPMRRFGHIRIFAALAALAASLTSLHAMFVMPWAWLVFRLLMGFCFAGLFMALESWLNVQSTSGTRGRVLALYMTATWFGVVGGKLIFPIAPAEAFQLFSAATIFIALSLVPVALTTGAAPTIPRPARTRFGELYRISPVGVVGCAAVGMANGAFWSFGPVFAHARNDSAVEVSLFMVACVLGTVIFQWPIGRFSDHVDRRWVVLGSCAVSVIAAVSLILQWKATLGSLMILGGLYGASALSLYALCVADANDRADAGAFIEVSSRMLMIYGLGSSAGAFLAGLLINVIGIVGLFLYTAAVHAALGIFAYHRIKMKEPVPEAERAVYSPHGPAAHETQAALPLKAGAEHVR